MASWVLDGPLGPERWDGVPGAWSAVSAGGEAASLDPAAGDLLLLGARAGACGHPGPFPAAFRFCPECGATLPVAPTPPRAESWAFPFGTATGQPPPEAFGTPDPASRREIPLPFPGRWTLFVAGSPPRLLAVEAASGALHAFVAEGQWRPLLVLPPAAALPRWSVAVAASFGGAVLPTVAGPVAVALSPFGAESVGPGAGTCRGGAASFGDAALVPAGPGLARLADGAWTSLAVSGGEDEVFAAPAVHPAGVFWPGRGGLLFAGPEAGVLGGVFRPWRPGFAPLLAVRPVRGADGTFHQLGLAEGTQCFEALLPPGATPSSRPFDRYLASAGSVCFAGNLRFREPWEARRLAYNLDGGFMVPLLPFAGEDCLVAVCTPRGALRSFIATEPETEAPVECRLAFATGSVVPTDLGLVLRARSAFDLAALVFRRTLLLHDVTGSRLWGWALDDR